jgi:hypothetical protein
VVRSARPVTTTSASATAGPTEETTVLPTLVVVTLRWPRLPSSLADAVASVLPVKRCSQGPPRSAAPQPAALVRPKPSRASAVSTGVGVGVAVWVWVAVTVAVAVGVSVGVGDAVGVSVGVSVGLGV